MVTTSTTILPLSFFCEVLLFEEEAGSNVFCTTFQWFRKFYRVLLGGRRSNQNFFCRLNWEQSNTIFFSEIIGNRKFRAAFLRGYSEHRATTSINVHEVSSLNFH